VYPEDWPEASQAPYLNVVGVDPELRDPANGDFRLKEGSPAVGYGCEALVQRPHGGAQVCESTASLLTACARSAARTSIEVSGDVTEDTVWSADTVRVLGPVTVAHGVSLGVSAGTRVEFQAYDGLSIAGRLCAVGTAQEPIYFTTADPGAFRPDSSTVGCWDGISFLWTSELNEPSLLEHCVLEYAKALDPEPAGGALSVAGFSKLTVRNSLFRSNVAVYGGAIACAQQSAPRFVGCLFEGNAAFKTGAALYACYSYPDLVACTLTDNVVLNEETFDPAGVVHNHISKSRVSSSIVYGNESSYFIETQMVEAKPFCVSYSDVESLEGGQGNTNSDPSFVGFGEHPYALTPGSPCENAGDPDSAGVGLPELDIAGEERISEGRLDMGAYEGAAATSVEAEPKSGMRLLCSPNPLVTSSRLSLDVRAPAEATLSVYDVSGRLVRRLFSGPVGRGEAGVRWDATASDGARVAQGVYFVRAVTAGGEEACAKLVVVR